MHALVYGGLGFIGFNLVRALIAKGMDVAVAESRDRVQDVQFEYLRSLPREHASMVFTYLLDLQLTRHDQQMATDLLFDLAAITDTQQGCSRELYVNNIERPSQKMIASDVIVFASTAAQYKDRPVDAQVNELKAYEDMSPYAWSKAAVEAELAQEAAEAAAVDSDDTGFDNIALRFFNVYGPYEWHKGRMASFPFQIWRSLRSTGRATVYVAGEGEAPFARDFISVERCAAAMIDAADWAYQERDKSSKFAVCDIGTGVALSLTDVAEVVRDTYEKETGYTVSLDYSELPDHWRATYQRRTQADPSPFTDQLSAEQALDEIRTYVRWLCREGSKWVGCTPLSPVQS